jgi:hypothetical protein
MGQWLELETIQDLVQQGQVAERMVLHTQVEDQQVMTLTQEVMVLMADQQVAEVVL